MSPKNFNNISSGSFSNTDANDIFSNFQGSGKKNTDNSKSEYIFKKIPVANIYLNPNNQNYNRFDTDEDIEDLAARIDVEGLLNPIIVYQENRNKYVLLSGERRFLSIQKLNWKEVECKVYTKISESLKTMILNESNLSIRELTPEQKFIGFKDIVEVLQENNEYDKDKVAKICSLSQYKMRQYKTIMDNVDTSDIDKLQKGEITFNDIKEIAEAKKELAEKEKRIRQASKIYAEALENPDIKFYIDRQNQCLFSVGKSTDHNKVYYGTKIHSYASPQKSVIFRWASSNELPECTTQNEAQVHLDSYAINHNLEECSVEEFINKTQISHDNPKRAESKKNTNLTESYFPEIVSQNADTLLKENSNHNNNDKDNVSENKENIIIVEKDDEIIISDTSPDNNSASASAGFQMKLLTDEKENNDINDNNEDEDEETVKSYKNNYALSILFVGEEINSHKEIKGFLSYDHNTDKYFIIPEIKIGKDLSTDKQSMHTIYGTGYEVEKNSIYTETRRK